MNVALIAEIGTRIWDHIPEEARHEGTHEVVVAVVKVLRELAADTATSIDDKLVDLVANEFGVE